MKHGNRAWRLLSATFAAAVLAAGLFSAGPAAAETVKIGVVLTYSGPQASTGDQIDKGLKLYIDKHQAELPPGVQVEVVRRDDGGPNPQTAKRLAQELQAFGRPPGPVHLAQRLDRRFPNLAALRPAVG